MKTQSWTQSRSEFNHDWLKNRLVMALCKAQNVLSGEVEDSSIWEHLEVLLAEWQHRREDARRLISDFRRSGNPTQTLADATFSGLDDDLKSWLADLADRRWQNSEQPSWRIKQALAAFSEFDREANSFDCILKRLRSDQLPISPNKQEVARLLDAAHALADAISSLPPSKV